MKGGHTPTKLKTLSTSHEGLSRRKSSKGKARGHSFSGRDKERKPRETNEDSTDQRDNEDTPSPSTKSVVVTTPSTKGVVVTTVQKSKPSRPKKDPKITGPEVPPFTIAIGAPTSNDPEGVPLQASSGHTTSNSASEGSSANTKPKKLLSLGLDAPNPAGLESIQVC